MRDTTNSVKYEAFVKSRPVSVPHANTAYPGGNRAKLDSKADLRYL